MTSMLLTERKGLPSPGIVSGLFLGAVARRDPFLLGVGGRGLLDHRAHDRLVRLDPVGDDVPLLAVPLLELDRAAPLVIHAGDLDRLQESNGAELLQALLVDVQVLQAPAHLLASERLLAELRLGGADRLRVQDAVNDAPVVIDRAETREVLQVPLVPARVAILLDVLENREIRSRRMKGRRDVALGRVAGRNHVLLRSAPPEPDDVITPITDL